MPKWIFQKISRDQQGESQVVYWSHQITGSKAITYKRPKMKRDALLKAGTKAAFSWASLFIFGFSSYLTALVYTFCLFVWVFCVLALNKIRL